MFGLRVLFWGEPRVVIPLVIPQFHLAGMTTPWRVAVQFAYPIIWHTATCTCLHVWSVSVMFHS